MTSKKYFKDELVRVSNTYMSADGDNTIVGDYEPANAVYKPNPKWDSTKTQGWIAGLTTGFNVFNPIQQPTGNPYLGLGNNPGGAPPPSNYGYGNPNQGGSSWILYTGIGLGVVAILIVTISAIKTR